MIHFIFLLSEVLPGERFTETEEIRLMGRNLKSKNLLDPCIVLACKNTIFSAFSVAGRKHFWFLPSKSKHLQKLLRESFKDRTGPHYSPSSI